MQSVKTKEFAFEEQQLKNSVFPNFLFAFLAMTEHGIKLAVSL